MQQPGEFEHTQSKRAENENNMMLFDCWIMYL